MPLGRIPPSPPPPPGAKIGLGREVGVTAEELLITTLLITLKGPLTGVECCVGKGAGLEVGGEVAKCVFRSCGGSPGGITNRPKPSFPIRESDGLLVWLEGDGGGGAVRLLRAFLNERVLPEDIVPLIGVEIPEFRRSSKRKRKIHTRFNKNV